MTTLPYSRNPAGGSSESAPYAGQVAYYNDLVQLDDQVQDLYPNFSPVRAFIFGAGPLPFTSDTDGINFALSDMTSASFGELQNDEDDKTTYVPTQIGLYRANMMFRLSDFESFDGFRAVTVTGGFDFTKTQCMESAVAVIPNQVTNFEVTIGVDFVVYPDDNISDDFNESFIGDEGIVRFYWNTSLGGDPTITCKLTIYKID